MAENDNLKGLWDNGPSEEPNPHWREDPHLQGRYATTHVPDQTPTASPDQPSRRGQPQLIPSLLELAGLIFRSFFRRGY